MQNIRYPDKYKYSKSLLKWTYLLAFKAQIIKITLFYKKGLNGGESYSAPFNELFSS